MDRHRIRNSIPPLYALLIIGGFLIGPNVGLVVIIVGGAISGVLWSMLSGSRGDNDGRRADRAAARGNRRMRGD
jgi:uncharacterized membrane protein YdjX (TVP38/TMEM64 family)